MKVICSNQTNQKVETFLITNRTVKKFIQGIRRIFTQ